MGGVTALIAAAVAAGSRLTELPASDEVRVLVGVLLVLGLILLLAAGGLAAWSIRPQAYSALHENEIQSFVKKSYLQQDSVQVVGTLLDGSVKAVTRARKVNRRKANRLTIAFGFFLAALAVMAGAGITLAIEGAT